MRNLRLLALLIIIPLLHGCAAAVIGGAGTAVIVGEDRRTVGTVAEDEGIELKAASRIRERFRDPHVNVTSYNRMVLLTGEAPDAATRSEIEKVARAVENVRGVHNEIAVSGNTALSARANDSYLTSKVKARFIDQQKFNVLHVKVVTEANVVYLLGLVKRKEADDATEIARTTGGVQKVVKLFDYLD
ncbi:MAG: BON domain-containing protein [Betaproteobacteria bacterium]|nr:BON domain-containing protein [Betaproteobacteria bacterium]MBI2293732.1 BON domain-containing protein [Betaproteobacteria bacterium]MBI3052704.1 BON domain-containing protein [Betaproteobacteria bacterium]